MRCARKKFRSMSGVVSSVSVAGRRMLSEESEIEKTRFALALQPHTEPPDGRLAAGFPPRLQGVATIARHLGKHRVLRIGGVACKIDSRDQGLQQSARKHHRIEMRGLVCPIRHPHYPRIDGDEAESSRLVGACAPESAESGRRPRLGTVGDITTSRVGLKNFDDGIVDWITIGIAHLAFDNNLFADSAGFCNDFIAAMNEGLKEKWADGLRSRTLHAHFSIGVAAAPRNTISKR